MSTAVHGGGDAEMIHTSTVQEALPTRSLLSAGALGAGTA